MNPRGIILSILGAALLAARAAGAATGASSSVSSAGAGDAAVAKADDAGALFLNPAGLAFLDRAEVLFTYGNPLLGLPGVSFQQGSLAAACPVGRRATLAIGGDFFDGAGLLKEYGASLGLAGRLGHRASAGLAVDALRHDYRADGIPGGSADPIFAGGTSKSAVGVGAGVLLRAASWLSLGASGRHLNRPDLGLVVEDRLPSEWRAGAAARWRTLTFLGEARGRRGGADEGSAWGAGVEWRAVSPLVVRGGMDDQGVSTGLSLAFRDLRIDYAFSLWNSLDAGEATGHRAALAYRFGAARGTSAVARPNPPRGTTPAARRPRREMISGGLETSTRDTRAYPRRLKPNR